MDKKTIDHNIIQDLLIEFLNEKKKIDPSNVHKIRTDMLNEFYVWLLTD